MNRSGATPWSSLGPGKVRQSEQFCSLKDVVITEVSVIFPGYLFGELGESGTAILDYTVGSVPLPSSLP